MADYISKNEVLNLIMHNDKVCHYADEHYENVVYATACRISDVVANMPASDVQPVDRWISVKDRLPENNKLVLCYAQSTTGEGCCYILGTLSNDEFWFLQAHDGHHLSFPNLHLVVTHWQPLPEPPVNP